MILNVGFGLSRCNGATPVTMLPPIMMALGFSPVASVALPCLGYDPLTSFSLLAVPITLPAAVFGFNAVIMGSNVALFLPVISTGLSIGMLWIADGIEGVRKGFVTAVLAGLSLGILLLYSVNILPASAIGLVGVLSGFITIRSFSCTGPSRDQERVSAQKKDQIYYDYTGPDADAPMEGGTPLGTPRGAGNFHQCPASGRQDFIIFLEMPRKLT